jgi:transcriptional regulator
MYLPRLFRVDDEPTLLELARAYPFATVISGSEIAHVPCLLDREGELVLRLHVARANQLAELARAGAEVTAIFHGPHAYVSPSWYEKPAEQVPTWSYAVVHATGRMRATSSDEGLDILRRTIAAFEGPDGWSERSLKEGLFESVAKGTVGIEVTPVTLQGKLKLSQNRSEIDQRRVYERLAGSDDPTARATAALMPIRRAR